MAREPMVTSVVPRPGRSRPVAAPRGPAARVAALCIFVAAAATGLNVALPFGGGALSAFDVLTLMLIMDFAVTAARRPIPANHGIVAGICGLLALAMTLPAGQHYVVRSAALVVCCAVVNINRHRATTIVNGFLAGVATHAVLAISGYLSSGAPRTNDDTFHALADWRAGFDWLVGPADNPPLVAQEFLRMEGFLGHANEFGALMAGAATVAMCSDLPPRRRLVLVALFLACTVLSLSRFSIAIGFVAVALLLRRRYQLTPRRYRVVAVAMAVPVFASIGAPLASRVLNVFDSENLSGRASSSAQIDDLTLFPDGSWVTWHSSPLWMLDVAGALAGTLWAVLLITAVATVFAKNRTPFTWIIALVLGLLFLTEDRIQSPSFLALVLVLTATVIQAQRSPVVARATRPAIQGDPRG